MLMQRFGAVALSVILAITQVSCSLTASLQTPPAASNLSPAPGPTSIEQKLAFDSVILPKDASPNDTDIKGTIYNQKNILTADFPASDSRVDVDVFSVDETLNLVALPDTQIYSQQYPDTFNTQTAWISENWNKEKFDLVVHLGDIVNFFDKEEQWRNAAFAISLLGDHPYAVLPGNHDYAYRPSGGTDYTLFDKYFSADNWSSSLLKGTFPSGTLRNSFVNVNGYLIINLGWYESIQTPLKKWIIATLDENCQLPAIIVTHHFLRESGEIDNQSKELWTILKDFPNVFLILSGHAVDPNKPDRQEKVKVLKNSEGSTVYAIMSNYQEYMNGNSGYFRIYKITGKKIEVKTFSPLNGYLTDNNSQFSLMR